MINFFKQNNGKVKALIMSMAFLVSSATQAQLWKPRGGDSAKVSKFEAGMSMYSLYVFEPGIKFRANDFARGNYYANGLYTRFYYRGNAFRFGFYHFEDALNFDKQLTTNGPFIFETPFPVDNDIKSAIRKMRTLQAGYQINITNTKLSPYFFGDAFYQYGTEHVFYTKEVVVNGVNFNTSDILVSGFKHLGLSAGLGLRLQMTSFLTISFETQLQAFYAWNKCSDPFFLKKDGTKVAAFPAQFLLGFYL